MYIHYLNCQDLIYLSMVRFQIFSCINMMLYRNCLKNCIPRYLFATAKPKKQKTYYQILEVPENATPTNIKKNYLKLAKIYHPDVYKGVDKTRFLKIQEAYKILSNQSQKGRYDQSIGIKSTYQPASQQGESSAADSTSDYGKASNEFRYTKPKVQINIDEEYQKFFNKKSQTNFEEIRLHEPTQFKAMSENERIRRRFTQVYTDPNLQWKMKYSKSYNEILNDQINQQNTYQKDQKQQKQKFEKMYTPEKIELKQKYIKIGAAAVFVLMLPFIFSFRTKMRLQNEAKQSYQRKVDTIINQMESQQVRQRMKFD